jgi:hypothetical protein
MVVKMAKCSDRERNGAFRPGHKKIGGRKAGTPNAMTPEFKKMILDVAAQFGSDGQGDGGW